MFNTSSPLADLQAACLFSEKVVGLRGQTPSLQTRYLFVCCVPSKSLRAYFGYPKANQVQLMPISPNAEDADLSRSLLYGEAT